jgi:hypothetical protein
LRLPSSRKSQQRTFCMQLCRGRHRSQLDTNCCMQGSWRPPQQWSMSQAGKDCTRMSPAPPSRFLGRSSHTKSLPASICRSLARRGLAGTE